ncbi:MAG: hypothetical protein KTR31_26825 [Myxococcales bacterium]|nr:hypothetical protein [Myxococcales bacterium]
MDPYAAPGADFAAEERADLPMVRYARMVLIGLAALNGLFAIGVPVLYGLIPMLDPSMDAEAVPVMIGVGLCGGLMVFGMGVVPMVAAVMGLNRGAKWGWILTVIIGALYVPSLCLPVGAFLLYAMLNEEVRKPFLDS